MHYYVCVSRKMCLISGRW